MINKLKILLLTALMLGGVSARADTIALALLLDGSGSVGSSGWSLQVNAYKNIFNSATFYDDYVVGGDTLMVRAIEFSSGVLSLSGWHTITDNASANTFAGAIGTTFLNGNTNTAAGVTYAANSLLGLTGVDRMVIDVSTDGVPCCTANAFNDALSALSSANSAGITTNFIGVGSGISVSQLSQLAGAGGGFYTTAADFSSFQTSLEDKLFHEIQGVPAPATFGLLGMALLGLAGMRRKAAA